MLLSHSCEGIFGRAANRPGVVGPPNVDETTLCSSKSKAVVSQARIFLNDCSLFTLSGNNPIPGLENSRFHRDLQMRFGVCTLQLKEGRGRVYGITGTSGTNPRTSSALGWHV